MVRMTPFGARRISDRTRPGSATKRIRIGSPGLSLSKACSARPSRVSGPTGYGSILIAASRLVAMARCFRRSTVW